MVFKLYGSAMAGSRVLVTLLEKNLPYEFIHIDITKGEQKTAEYKKLQPFGKVPVLDDDGFVIFESRAICKYLDRKYPLGKKLMPDNDDTAYGRFEQACSIEQSMFAFASETIGKEMFIKPKANLGTPNMEIVAQAEKELDTLFAYYDKILARHKYLLGDEITLVDLFHLPNGAALKAGKWKEEVFEKYPNVDRWFTDLQGRETWVKAAAEAGTIP